MLLKSENNSEVIVFFSVKYSEIEEVYCALTIHVIIRVTILAT